MLTPKNIRQVNFFDNNNPVTLIYNKTHISDDMVSKAVDFGLWKLDPRLIQIKPGQLQYLEDKKDEEILY